MNADLLRQRRNLILVSAILVIFDFAKVTITKVNVLGTELLVGNAQILMGCAWILWAYFLLRYYQYWRAEEHKPIRSIFKQRFDKYVRSYTSAAAIQDSNGQVFDKYKISRSAFAEWAYTLQGYDPAEGRIKDGTTHSLPAWRLGIWLLKSAASVCIQTPHATDHVLPFAIASAAPAMTLYTKWQLL